MILWLNMTEIHEVVILEVIERLIQFTVDVGGRAKYYACCDYNDRSG